MYNLGYPIYPDGIFGDVYDKATALEKHQMLNRARTWVIEFPVKTSALSRAADETALDQLQRYFDLQQYYTDHNTSITIYFAPDEVPDLIEMLLEKWDDYIGVSFAVKDSGVYPLMPYEEITEEEYTRRYEAIKHIGAEDINTALTALESQNMATDLEDADCVSGACPVR